MDFKFIGFATVIFLLLSVISGCIENGRDVSWDTGDKDKQQDTLVDTENDTASPAEPPVNDTQEEPGSGNYTPEPPHPEPEEIEQIQDEPEEIDLSDSFQREFNWSYGGYKWSITLEFFPETYELYKNRSRERDYDLFVSDPYDDELITDIVSHLAKAGKETGLDDTELSYLVVSFVQSLPYTSDDVTTGFDEYPRFPYETLYDNGGDCEDASILVSALLEEMGYGVVLIELPEHVAAGIECSEDFPGYYYMHEGRRYCYMETTGENWPIGEIPDEYKGREATIIQVYKRPFLDVDLNARYSHTPKDVYVDVNVYLRNLGSEKAENTKIYVALQTSDTSKVWDDIESEYLQILPEEGYNYYVENLHAPTGEEFRVYVRAYGDNVISDESVSVWVNGGSV